MDPLAPAVLESVIRSLNHPYPSETEAICWQSLDVIKKNQIIGVMRTAIQSGLPNTQIVGAIRHILSSDLASTRPPVLPGRFFNPIDRAASTNAGHGHPHQHPAQQHSALHAQQYKHHGRKPSSSSSNSSTSTSSSGHIYFGRN